MRFFFAFAFFLQCTTRKEKNFSDMFGCADIAEPKIKKIRVPFYFITFLFEYFIYYQRFSW
jgi:hypothetical protein